MGWTETQKRYFGAAAKRSRDGAGAPPKNTAELEADEERPPVHKAEGGKCYACGGSVGEDGKAAGGAEDEGPSSFEEESTDSGRTSQDEESDELRDGARRRFVSAMRERR